jgi:thioredoxin-related protein
MIRKLPLVIVPVFIALIALSFSRKPAAPAEGEIKWMNWKELQEAQKREPRKVVVDVFTGWCGWCKRMEASTFTNQEIIDYVNKNFYAVKFDAETQQTINFKGKDYKFIPQGVKGYNELAADILNNQMSYPTTVYFDESLNEIFPVPGYQEPKVFETVLNYVASNSYKSVNYDNYQQAFKGKVK